MRTLARWKMIRGGCGPLVVALSLACSAAFAANHPDKSQAQRKGDGETAARQIDAANGMLGRGLYDLAEAEYRAALTAKVDDGTKATAQYGLAICLYRQGRFEETVTALEPLVEIKAFAFGAEIGIMRGQSLLSLGRFDEAAEIMQQVAASHPDHKLASQAIVGAIEALYRSGANADAAQYARKMTDHISHAPTRNRAEILQAAAMMNIHDAASAATLLRKLLDRGLEPKFEAQVRVMLGQCASQVGNLADAVIWFEGVLSEKVEASHGEARLGLADALYRLGKLDESKRAVMHILDGQPDDRIRADATMILGRIQFDKGAFAVARDAFETVRDIGQANRVEAEYWIAKCALRMGSAREAVELFDRWNKSNVDHAMNVEATYDHAVALIEAEQFGAATEVLTDFRKRFLKHALNSAALHLLAVTAFRSDDDAMCEQLCGTYMQEFANGSEIANVVSLAGRCAFRGENWRGAVEWNTRFAQRFPADARVADANFRAGVAAYRLEEFDAAETHFAKLLVNGAMPKAYAVASLALGDIRFQAKDWTAADRWLSSYLASGTKPPSGDEALLKRGIARRRLGQSSEALADFDALPKRWPDSPHYARALLERGETLALQGDGAAAKSAFAQAVEANGGQSVAAQAVFQQAVLAMQGGDYSVAAKYLSDFLAMEDDPNRRAEALYQRGQCHLGSSDFQKAFSDFAAVNQKHSAHDRAADALAWSFVSLVRQDKLPEALALWSERLKPVVGQLDARTQATVFLDWGWALRATGDSAKAAKAYGSVLAIADADTATHAHATLALAEIEIESDGCTAGAKRLATLIAKDPTEPIVPPEVRQRALFRSGSCALDAERWAESQAQFAMLLDEFPETENATSTHLYSGEALMQLGRFSEAREHLELVAEDCNDNKLCSAATLRLGECLAAQQQWAQSERVLQEFLTRFGEERVWYQAQFGLGWAREHQDRHDDAIKAYRELVDRHQGPTAARAQFQIGECLFAKGEHDAAAREFLKVDIFYDYPEWSAAAIYETGRCFELMGRRVEARANFQDVIDRFGDSKWAGLAANRIPHLATSVVPGH